MSLNKAKGNMYPFVNLTWNPISGVCPYACTYCYAYKMYNRFGIRQHSPKLIEHMLDDDLGQDNIIFVGSMCDMFHPNISSDDIQQVFKHCYVHDNLYLFQSKNPQRIFNELLQFHPDSLVPAYLTSDFDVLIGTTIETDKAINLSKAPSTYTRYKAMADNVYNNKMISIEPIMDFNLNTLALWIEDIGPKFVSIGADSGANNLDEPSWPKVQALINKLEQFTKAYQKDNLGRLAYD